MPKEQTYLTATGDIRFRMTNDFMFRTILQRNRKVLRGLVSAMLHIRPEEITTITIENPIDLGQSIQDKDLILDIRVRLNNQLIINLEMQVIDEHNWIERSLLYLCRAFDQLKSGGNYKDILPTIHIGFLDFPVFQEYPELYATYKLLNTKNYHLYSDKFTLHVLDLTCIDLATEEDKSYGIDHWARLFKATTWEDMRMIAENNEYMNETMQALYESNADPIVWEQCRARETRLFFERIKDAKIEDLSAEVANLRAEMNDKDSELACLKAELARLKALSEHQK